MSDLITWVVDLIYHYDKDKANGVAWWQDPAVIGLVVSFAGTEIAKFAGITITSDLQLKIVGVVTGIGALLSNKMGIMAVKKAAAAPAPGAPGGLSGPGGPSGQGGPGGPGGPGGQDGPKQPKRWDLDDPNELRKV